MKTKEAISVIKTEIGQFIIDEKWKNALALVISALEKQDVPDINVGDTIDLQFLQPESENVFYDSDHGFCINTQDVLDYLRKELRNG